MPHATHADDEERNRLAQRVAELEAALKPFAWVGEQIYPAASDQTQSQLAVPYGVGLPNAGQWRRAAELLSSPSPTVVMGAGELVRYEAVEEEGL